MEFANLASKIALCIADSKDYISWAEALLSNGSDSENVAILASLGLDKSPDRNEVEFYFSRVIKELNLILPPSEDNVYEYAKFICLGISDGNIQPLQGLSALSRLYEKYDYKPIFSIWMYLSEDVSMVETNESCYFNTGLTKENIDCYISKVARQFLRLLEITLPEDFFDLCYCEKCGVIGKSNLERIDLAWMPDSLYKFIFRKGPMKRTICANCGNPFPPSMIDLVSRERFLSVMR